MDATAQRSTRLVFIHLLLPVAVSLFVVSCHTSMFQSLQPNVRSLITRMARMKKTYVSSGEILERVIEISVTGEVLAFAVP